MRVRAAAVAALVLSAFAVGGATAITPVDDQDTIVPVGKNSNGFGRFKEAPRPEGDRGALENVFGKPDVVKARSSAECRLRWRGVGVLVTLTAFGTATKPCTRGQFTEARLYKKRWHTRSGVHPGVSKRFAKRFSKRTCRVNSCGVAGYALELHRIDCAQTRVPGVIAKISGGRVTQLIVRWRGCE